MRAISIKPFVLIVLWALITPSAFAQSDRAIKRVRAEMASEKRVALVIGNGTYQSKPLRNPVNDARAVADALRSCGFEVTEKLNCNRVDMLGAIRNFGDQIDAGGVGLFYYAGHGLQVKGQNYLVPVDAAMQREDEVEDWCVQASAVLRKMETAGNRVNIVILDACRNNPYESSFRSSSQGLARMDAPKGSFVAYATAPGSVASDGDGSNGLYTSALLKVMREPDLKIEDVFKRVRAEVTARTSDAQIPWELSSLVGDFYFELPSGPSTAPGSAALPPIALSYGHLQVNVNVAKSKVYVDGTYRGEASPGSPLNLNNMSTGNVVVRVESAGKSKEARYAIKANAWTQAILELPVTPLPTPTPSLPTVPEPTPSSQTSDDMAWIPAGEFLMGSNDGDDNEKPVHKVYVDGFYMDKYKVTVAQYRSFVRAKGRSMPKAHYESEGWQDNHPMISVSWNDAKAYCEWKGKRLPTEAEWEKAARGGLESKKYPWGDVPPNLAAYDFYDDGTPKTIAVGTYEANGYGLYDIVSNIWEWCNDWYDEKYYDKSPSRNPIGPITGRVRVVRGGGHFSGVDVWRIYKRNYFTPAVGIRCAKGK